MSTQHHLPMHIYGIFGGKKNHFFVQTEHHTRKNSSVSLLIDASNAAQWINAIHSECKSASALLNWSIKTYQGSPVPKELTHF
jgi:hypothetical protein